MRYTCKESQDEENLIRDYVKVVRDITSSNISAILEGANKTNDFSTNALLKPELIKALISLIWNNPKRTEARDTATGKYRVNRSYGNEILTSAVDKLLLDEIENNFRQRLGGKLTK